MTDDLKARLVPIWIDLLWLAGFACVCVYAMRHPFPDPLSLALIALFALLSRVIDKLWPYRSSLKEGE